MSGAGDIKLLDISTMKITQAFTSPHELGRMCHGDNNNLYVYTKGGSVLELNYSTIPFTVTKALNSGLSWCCGLCYVPASQRSIVLSSDVIRAVSVDRNEIQWEIQGEG